MKITGICALFFLLLSCSADSGTDTEDRISPVITIQTPAQNQVLISGQQIPITGTITDNGIIAEVHIHVFNNNTGVKYLDIHLFPGNEQVNFNNTSLMALVNTLYKIQVIATDRSGNQSSSSVTVTSN